MEFSYRIKSCYNHAFVLEKPLQRNLAVFAQVAIVIESVTFI